MIEEEVLPLAKMPYSPTAEEAVLGSVLIDGEAMRTISLQPDDFYVERNQWVWAVMQELRGAGQRVDYITVCEALDRKGKLTEMGGPARIMQLIATQASSLYVDSYVEIVKNKAKRRNVLRLSQKLAMAAMDQDTNLETAVSDAVDRLSRSVVSARGADHVSAFVSQVYDEVEAAIKSPRDIFGIPTGLTDFDQITGGLQRGEVIKLSGEPGLGKSLLAFQMLCGAAEKGYPGALYELEMSGRQVVRRRISAMSKIQTRIMRSGRVREEDIPVFTQMIEIMSNLPIYISDSSIMTTADIRVDMQRLREMHGVKVMVIDYEGLLADDPDKDDTTRSKIISSRVHGIAKDLNVAALVIDDMNKAGITGQVQGKGALAGSARKLHDADQIVIMRNLPDSKTRIRLTWEKMREGESDRFMDLDKVTGFPAFKDIPRL